VAFNGCSVQPRLKLPLLDLLAGRNGADTVRQEFADCLGGAVELWTSLRSGHQAQFDPALAEAIADFLLDHPKPAALDSARPGTPTRVAGGARATPR
jgi:hypothetical protein